MAMCCAGAMLASLLMPIDVSAQGGNKPVPATGFARVPERQTFTDVKMSAGSGSEVIVLVPKGTVMPIIGRQGEWVQVQIAPELRQLGIPMRWYRNETAGFVHDSTVEILKEKPPPQQSVRVAQSQADIKQGSSSGSVVMVLVPKGTILPVIGRQGEWIQVRLAPELRHVGTLMRWYNNEQAGFVHESLVEFIK
jgi:hypothetical protein